MVSTGCNCLEPRQLEDSMVDSENAPATANGAHVL